MSEPDPASVAGKQPPISVATDLLIIGAGPAGLSAALTAAGRGARVTLVDENPIPLKTMGEEVPLHFGGRMAATLANRNAVLEHIVATNPQLLEVMDAGVDVRLGTAAWGLFPQHPTAAWIDAPVAGLADDDSVYLMRFKQAIVATGRRDMGLAFTGWQRPGVMGLSAAYRLATTYAALESKVAVLVGSDTHALQAAEVLAERGVRIEAILERSAQIVGSTVLLERLIARGTRVLTRHTLQEAYGDSFGVTGVGVVGGQGTQMLTCDTVLLGVGTIPTIELLEACGCKVTFQADRGGHVPTIDASQRTSLPDIYVAGDCAGVWAGKSLSESIARQEGRIAAHAALSALDWVAELPVAESSIVPESLAHDISEERKAWVRACVLNASADTPVCQCEEVTAAKILSLKQTPDPDTVKRLTRAGMGPCQGRRCREQIAALIAVDANIPLADVPLATYRTPVRPLTLAQMATLPESPHLGPHWDSWFGMRTQWIPFWRARSTYTVATRDSTEPVGGE
jgi:pyruvate/2-oxoglutarate dehydrogenase complex dihydrolipoamide dehydrogenase (E3) component